MRQIGGNTEDEERKREELDEEKLCAVELRERDERRQ